MQMRNQPAIDVMIRCNVDVRDSSQHLFRLYLSALFHSYVWCRIVLVLESINRLRVSLNFNHSFSMFLLLLLLVLCFLLVYCKTLLCCWCSRSVVRYVFRLFCYYYRFVWSCCSANVFFSFFFFFYSREASYPYLLSALCIHYIHAASTLLNYHTIYSAFIQFPRGEPLFPLSYSHAHQYDSFRYNEGTFVRLLRMPYQPSTWKLFLRVSFLQIDVFRYLCCCCCCRHSSQSVPSNVVEATNQTMWRMFKNPFGKLAIKIIQWTWLIAAG